MTPSTPILSPGFITIISPSTISSKLIFISFSFLITIAVFGAKLTNLLIASLVFPLDFASKYFPNVIRVTIVPADSKYISLLYFSTSPISLFPNPISYHIYCYYSIDYCSTTSDCN